MFSLHQDTHAHRLERQRNPLDGTDDLGPGSILINRHEWVQILCPHNSGDGLHMGAVTKAVSVLRVRSSLAVKGN